MLTRRQVVLLHAVLGAGLLLLLPARETAAATRYVFAVFKGDAVADEKLSVYTSTDGLNFRLLANTGYGGPTGVLRDPTIMKHSDGKYYIAHTTNSWTTTSNNFAIASSTDLVTWTHLVTVDAQVANVQHTWAPEWFKDSDGSINIIVSIDTNTAAFRPYKFTAMDGTLTRWGAPTPIGIQPNYIDTFIVRIGGTYHAIAKNETTKYIEHATAPSLTGPWTWVGTGDWAGWGSGKEGPALFQLDSGQWRLFLDCYSGCGYLYTDNNSGTGGDFATWSSTRTVPGGLSGVVRHGTVLREDDAVDGGAPDAMRADGSAGSGGGGRGGSSGVAGGGGRGGSSGVAGGGGGGAAGTGGSGGMASAGVGGGRSDGGIAGGNPDASSTGGTDAGGTGGNAGTGIAGGSGAGGRAGSGGSAVAGAGGQPNGPSGGGCSCVVGDEVTTAPSVLLMLVFALLARRRSGRRPNVERGEGTGEQEQDAPVSADNECSGNCLHLPDSPASPVSRGTSMSSHCSK
jgi:hypothetical protein